MVRPKAKELTERELAIMRVFWEQPGITAEEARKSLQKQGTKLAYVTIANVVRALVEKDFLKAENDARPFRYQPTRSQEDVSRRLLGNLVKQLFDGSRERLLVHMFGKQRLTPEERETLEKILKSQGE